jgi:hypothetical protein
MKPKPELSKDEMFLGAMVMFVLLCVLIFGWWASYQEWDFMKPTPAPMQIASTKPEVIIKHRLTSEQWEKLNKRVIERGSYLAEPELHAVEKFIDENKDEVERIQDDM